MVLSFLCIVLAVLSIIFSWHLSLVYHRFNEQIKKWSENLDASTRDAIDRSARKILRELDEKITEQNAHECQELENKDVESLNNKENE